jgi:hypothetical protein|tara:strand:- start:122 stop:1426 length:1305 start_codon:yes stop_codon:yes gene_type:complete
LKKNLFYIILSLISINSFSQGSASPYSFYGIGSLNFNGTTENRAMGRLSMVTDSIHMNFRNPASFTGNDLKAFNNEGRLVKFTVSVGNSDINFKTQNASAKSTTTSFDYLGMSVPMGKFGMGFGLIPHSSVGYKLESLDNDDLIKYKYSGKGGLNKVLLGLAYQFSESLALGMNFDYNFGNIQNNGVEFLYDDDSEPLDYHSREANRSDLSGFSYNLGITFKPMLTDVIQLHSAFTYSPDYNLNSDNSRTFSSIVINSNSGEEYPINEINVDLESLGLKETNLSMPSKTSIGFGIGKIKKWFIGTEYTFVNTSVFKSDLINIDNSSYEDGSTISFGGYFIPEFSSFNNLLKRIVYRSGIYFEKTGLIINDQSISEVGMTFGVGIPVGNMFSNLNLALEVGNRGTTDANLVEEKFANLKMSLSLNDRWFVKRKYN